MEVKAKLRHLHIAPRKVRLVIDAIRGMDTQEALQKLDFIQKGAAKPITGLLKSAIANAEHNFNLDKDNLYVKEIRADEGPKLKRWQPRAFGRAYPIIKRSSHVSIILAEKFPGKKKKKAPPVRETAPARGIARLKRVMPIKSLRGKAPATEGEPPGVWDKTRAASRRHKQHEDKKILEKKRSLRGLRRFFRRKSA